MIDLPKVNWTDMFLVSGSPEKSFLQDAVSSSLTRLNAPELRAGVESLISTMTNAHKKAGGVQDFRLDKADVPELGMGFRVSVRETMNGRVFVCRRFPYPPSTLSRLGFRPSVIKSLLDEDSSQHGLVLFTGRTGSGKSTAAAAYLKDWLKRFGGVAWTVENPVEIALEGEHGENGQCFQVEVSDDDDFGPEIHATLRDLPRVILVGEVRNGVHTSFSPGARAALHAASTGHLVVGTMHANDIESSIASLISMIERDDAAEHVAMNLRAVLNLSLTTDDASGKRMLHVDPLILNGENADKIRANIRDRKLKMLSSEIEAQRRMYSDAF